MNAHSDILDDVTPSPLGGFVTIPADGPADRRVSGGSGKGFAFTLWPAVLGAPVAERLDVFFKDELVWTTGPIPVGADSWNSFLAGLSASWTPLRFQQSYPGGVTPRKPSLAFDQILREVTDTEQAKLIYECFRFHHDMAAWFGASTVRLSPLFLMREGPVMIAESGDRLIRWYVSDLLRTLERLGDVVCGRLRAFGGDETTVGAWDARETGPTNKDEAWISMLRAPR